MSWNAPCIVDDVDGTVFFFANAKWQLQCRKINHFSRDRGREVLAVSRRAMPAEGVFGDAAGECAAPATFPKNRNKHAHVPREEWRRLHPKPAVSGNEDTGDFGSHGGPRRPREVLGIERSQTQLDAANSGNLQLWGLPSVESYFELEDARLRSIQELDVFMRDGKNSPRNKHHECAKHHMKWGRSTHNCGECWLMKGNCVCSELTNCTPKIAPHRVVAYVHHLEFGRGNSSGCLIKRCLGGELLVAGLKEHEEKLQKICHENKGRIAVLWPRGTVEFGEILASVGGMERGAGGIDISAGSAGEDTCDSSPRDTPCDSPGRETPCDSSGRDTPSSNSPETSNSGWTFIAVDATWNCARKMVKRIPVSISHLPHFAD